MSEEKKALTNEELAKVTGGDFPSIELTAVSDGACKQFITLANGMCEGGINVDPSVCAKCQYPMRDIATCDAKL